MMYKTWVSTAADEDTVARGLEAHLNEFAEEVISVSYSVAQKHHVLAVYRPIEPGFAEQHEIAVSVAEHIIDHG
jgi:hypothetical protein